MSDPDKTQSMPQSVSVARICMWIQAGLGLVGILLAVALLSGAPALFAAMLVALAISLVATAFLGFLAGRMASRRGWVRGAGLISEGVLILSGVWGLLDGATIGIVLGVALAAVAFWQLCRASSARWFDR